MTVDWNILDVNALAENIKNLALDAFTSEASPIIADLVSPLEQAVRYSWEDGIQRFEMELFNPRFTLRDSAPIAISGVVAGDDSLDLAEHTDTLTSGDYSAGIGRSGSAWIAPRRNGWWRSDPSCAS